MPTIEKTKAMFRVICRMAIIGKVNRRGSLLRLLLIKQKSAMVKFFNKYSNVLRYPGYVVSSLI